jgi:hypothetical protein
LEDPSGQAIGPLWAAFRPHGLPLFPGWEEEAASTTLAAILCPAILTIGERKTFHALVGQESLTQNLIGQRVRGIYIHIYYRSARGNWWRFACCVNIAAPQKKCELISFMSG